MSKKDDQDKYFDEYNRRQLDANCKLIRKLADYGISFDEFRLLARLWFSANWRQWTVHVSDLEYFYYFSPFHYSSGAWNETDVLRDAYTRFQLILAHGGMVNIPGVFLESERVDLYRTKDIEIYAKVVFSPILGKWFAGHNFNSRKDHSGSSSSPLLADSQAFTSKEDAIASVRKQLDEWSPSIASLLPTQTRQPSLFE